MPPHVTNEELFLKLEFVIQQNKDILVQNNEQKDKVNEMYEIFSGLLISSRWLDKIVKYIFAILVGVGSLALMIKQLYK